MRAHLAVAPTAYRFPEPPLNESHPKRQLSVIAPTKFSPCTRPGHVQTCISSKNGAMGKRYPYVPDWTDPEATDRFHKCRDDSIQANGRHDDGELRVVDDQSGGLNKSDNEKECRQSNRETNDSVCPSQGSLNDSASVGGSIPMDSIGERSVMCVGILGVLH